MSLSYDVDFYDIDGTLAHNATVRDLAELEELAQGRRIVITGRGVMPHDEAMLVIDAYREEQGADGTLEALQHMKAVRDTLTHRQRHAFDVIFEGFRRLFHGEAK